MVILSCIIAVAVLFLELYPGIGKAPGIRKRMEYKKKSENYYNRKFNNENEYKMMTGMSMKMSAHVRPKGKVPVVKSNGIPEGEKGKLNVTWFGHSTILVQMGERNVLIDPVLTAI